MNKLLQNAQKKLSIKSVLTHRCLFEIGNITNILNLNTKTRKQGFNSVTDVNIFEPSDQGENNPFVYIFDYSLGLRVVECKDDKDTNIDNKPVIFLIEATFKAIYTSKEKLLEEELKEFAKDNVGYHVWPYWRELVQSCSVRTGITPIDIPFYKSKIK